MLVEKEDEKLESSTWWGYNYKKEKDKQQIAFDCKICCLWKALSWPKSQWSLMLIIIPKIGDDDDDDVCIMMTCVSVFVSRKMITFLKVCLSICNVLSSLLRFILTFLKVESGGAKRDVDNTLKCTRLNCILTQWSRSLGLAGRWLALA